MRPVTIHLDHASVHFGEFAALNKFSGSFTPGTVTALIGGDGAGKSTLLKLLAGRLSPRQGSNEGLPVDRRNLGYQPADSGVWRNLSVAENIEFVARSYGLTAADTHKRSTMLLQRAGLEHVAERLVGKLSGGMRQKLGVVLATLHGPGLVLLDEPTTGVDPISRAELWSLIAGAAADGATVVFATTYLDEAERASQLFLLGSGTLLAAGTPEEVIANAPGTVWRAPATGESARIWLDSERVWRRANTLYRWDPDQGNAVPEGFLPAVGDLENASVALLLSEEARKDAAEPLPIPEPATLPHPTAFAEPSEQPKTMRAPLVRVHEVTREYGVFAALGGVSMRVVPGEVVGLLGGNGAGKTTLMRILLGLETATTGVSELFGSAPSLATRRRIGYVAQGLGLYPALSATENLQFAAAVHGVTVDEQSLRYARSLGRAAIESLPLGTKRTLAYLAANVHRPELLVLDEPSSGMDALSRARLWRNLRAAADDGTGVLVTTHYMQEAEQCDRLVILAAGRVIAEGTVAEITEGYSSFTVATVRWAEAFTLLRNAGIAAILDGRTLRVPGVDRGIIEAALAPLQDGVQLAASSASIAEAMALAAGVPGYVK
ncbi:ABC transporter ATP-binding protein [Leucobacter insecticola]|uniref:ABC transporter ATP-binding protein n=1 Tax=Leucobacter insecticola TaxID=2714934 RepID=A0A6G8FK71_9MICO|nr:ATP-binding cassette domain-containing protein [Leucobacter insecticola]QIM16870.1 ABC transporter ATP-binding protein [Leucobacter insecticola]